MGMIDYQQSIFDLFEEQKLNWPLLRDNHKNLEYAKLKVFDFNGFKIKLQFNPERIVSSAAKVDKDSISKRKCFLCKKNRPMEQKEVLFNENYEFLCNPFPIFESHFTISEISHIPQEINDSFDSFLKISAALPKLVIFYNAPNCGASAPDHLHFQAGNTGFLPVESELESLKSLYGQQCSSNREIDIVAIDDGLRKFIVLESKRKDLLTEAFKRIHDYSQGELKKEPAMLNILAYYKDSWKILVFPREKHRPWQYFEKGNENILLSPASVDMGGTLITPLEKDFNKLSKDDIEDIFNQVCISAEKLQEYVKLFKFE